MVFPQTRTETTIVLHQLHERFFLNPQNGHDGTNRRIGLLVFPFTSAQSRFGPSSPVVFSHGLDMLFYLSEYHHHHADRARFSPSTIARPTCSQALHTPRVPSPRSRGASSSGARVDPPLFWGLAPPTLYSNLPPLVSVPNSGAFCGRLCQWRRLPYCLLLGGMRHARGAVSAHVRGRFGGPRTSRTTSSSLGCELVSAACPQNTTLSETRPKRPCVTRPRYRGRG